VRPGKGTFGISNSTVAAYRAGNTLGADRFVARVDWERSGKRVYTDIEVSVTIVDRID
jgi:hypothetical protein